MIIDLRITDLVDRVIMNKKIVCMLLLVAIFLSCKDSAKYDCSELKNTYAYEGFYEEDVNGQPFLVEWKNDSVFFAKKAIITFNDISDVYLEERFDGDETISVRFSEKGKKEFYELSKRNVDKHIGIFVQNELISAPIITSEIDGGGVEIYGNKSADWRQKIFRYLSAKINCRNASYD